MKTKLVFFSIVFLALIVRFYHLSENPPSLYWDEASLGYNAYSIAQTLHDEHGNFLPLASFPAFGDYKAPGYIYSDAVLIKILGLSEFVVRLPSALAGTFLVLVTYLLVLELLKNKKVALLSAFFIAVSPWSIQMSRAAFEANLATLFSALGLLLFLRKKIISSAFFFVLAMYTFNSHRVFVPIILAFLVLIHIKDILRDWKRWIIFPTLFFILLLPLIPFVMSKEGKLRFNEVTWLNDLSIVEESNKDIASANNAIWAKIIYNRRVFYVEEFAKHYFDHYRFNFLFQTGDINPRLSARAIGEMYLLDLPFCLFGIFFLLKKRDKQSLVIFLWILLAPIPAAVARETPHALRTLNILPMPQLLSAIGLVFVWETIKKNKILKYGFTLLVSVIVIASVYFYLNNYYFIYRAKYVSDWQYGYKQMVQYVSSVENSYDHIWVTGRYGRPYIYFLFYNQYSPQKFWSNGQTYKDQFGFLTVIGFDKFVFNDDKSKSGKWLYVDSPTDNANSVKPLKTIYNLLGDPVFIIHE